MHHDDAIDVETADKLKPEIITLYNRTKSGVDTVDQLCVSYDCSRNSRRWPLTVFFRLMNIAGINARVISYLNNNKNVSRRSFLKKLGLDLIADSLKQRAVNPRIPRNLKQAVTNLSNIPQSSNSRKRPAAGTQQRCAECPRAKDRKTKYMCRICNKYLCLDHIAPLCSTCVM